MQFYTLSIASIKHPIEDAVSIQFHLPDELYERFSYYPGQHLIIKFKIDDQEVRRTYSLNSSPFVDEPLEITIKRVKKGLVSNYANESLKVGDQLEVSIPQGRFYADVQKDAYKTYFLFAAGSGMTPIFSILKSVLLASPYSMVYFFYGNSNQDTIAFKPELDALEQQYSQRLKVVHTLSKPKVWTTWEQWTGRKGRIDAAAVEWFITQHPPIAQHTEYYSCGPGAMNICVRDTLRSLGVPKELVHIEQFGGAPIEDTTITAVENAVVNVEVNQQTHQLNIPKGQTILQTIKAGNIEVPYSCESGVCGSCVAKIMAGTAEMKACMALEDADIQKGLVLTCQALPTSEKLTVAFE